MSWIEVSVMSQRKEFVALATDQEANISELCRRYGISRKTGYKWLGRAATGEEDWFRDRSRRPHRSREQIAAAVEAAIVAERERRPAWGARKIRACLERAGWSKLPAASTVHAVLRRQGLLESSEAGGAAEMQRFERDSPNELWQMDFKEKLPTARGPCYPLTVLDDHSRFSVCVEACGNQREATVRAALNTTPRRAPHAA